MIHPWESDKLREECGIFGYYGKPVERSSAHEDGLSLDAVAMTTIGLHALQHRGQEAAGVTTFDGSEFHTYREMGHVADQLNKPEIHRQLPGHSAIGHVRYSTAGESTIHNAQPLFAEIPTGGFAYAHNGNLSNAQLLRRQLISQGSIFQSKCDSEVIVHLTARSSYRTLEDRLIDALRMVEGAYSLVALTTAALIGIRDPLGIRPLVLGRIERDGSWILASETCALDIVGARLVRSIKPGEMIVISKDGCESHFPFNKAKPKPCIFEHVYFTRPDSIIDNVSVYEVRKRIGAELCAENPVDADLVVPVPDSGTPAAIGYSQAAGLPFELGIIRNHYVGRTFIEPGASIRNLGVKLKHNPNRSILKGKRLILIDDSIVRGTTSSKIVTMLRECDVREIHLRIASPPTSYSCFYGVDTPQRGELMAAQHNLNMEKMCETIGADSLAFLSIDGLYRATGQTRRNNASPQYCDACFTGEYPTKLTDMGETESGELI